MRRILTVFTIIFLLTSCSQAGPGVVATETIAPTMTTVPTATIGPTMTPAPTATQEISEVEQLLTALLAGESIDVSSLSPAEFREFSTQVAEQRNAERGVKPIIYNNEAYLSPDSYRLVDYDGYPDLNETIEMYLPVIGKDNAGNLQILNQDGQTVTIANSADVDWNMVVTDPHDSRIDWPTLPNDFVGGLTLIEYSFADFDWHGDVIEGIFIVPTILLDKTMGQIFIEGRGKGFTSIFRFLTVADTDVNGVPVSFRLSLAISGPGDSLTMEGSDVRIIDHNVLSVSEKSDFYVNLQENSVYYMGLHREQEDIWDSGYHTTMDVYQGLIADNEITSILTCQTENTQDMMLLLFSLLIQKK